jgi:hypothetical protein
MHRFTFEVLHQRLARDRLVSVCRERSRQNGDESEGRLEGLVEDVGDFVLKV